jgi:probable F420-dependent oxidoreductase
MTPAFDPGPSPHGVPKVLVGALGPRMTQMAAEVADGILVMPFNSARHFAERTMPAIERAPHDPAREIVAEVIVALREKADVKGLLAFYGSTPSYRPVLDVEGWGELQPELNALSKQGGWKEMATRITDDMVDILAVAGTAKECAQQMVDRFPGVSRFCCYFPGYPVTDAEIGELVTQVKALGAPPN